MRTIFNRICQSSVLCLAATLLVMLAAPSVSSAQSGGYAPTYQAGGKSIVIPPLTSEFVEVGSDNRKILEVAVPDSNRLVAAFVLTNDLPSFKSGSNQQLLRYAMVEVPRDGESADFTAKDFKEMTDSANQELGNAMTSTSREMEEEYNRKVKALNLDAQASLDKPVSLGCLFSKRDAYGFGMLMSVTMHGTTTNMINASALVRVRNRLVFAYVYAVYKDQSSLQWARKAVEDWADAILKANEQ